MVVGTLFKSGYAAVMTLIVLLSASLVFVPAGALGELPTPQNLAAVPGNGTVRLTWDPANVTVEEYWVFRATQGDLELWTTLGNVTSFLDIGLVNGQTYRYALQAKGPEGVSNLSSEASATPRTVPSAPLDPKAVPGNRYLLLTWSLPSFDGGSNITEYRVYEAEALIGNCTGQEFVHSLLAPGIVHTYRVRAVNEAGEGPASIAFSGVPDIPPAPPSNLSVAAGVNNATLTWDRPLDNGGSGPSGFTVYRAVGSGVMKTVLSLNASSTGYVDYGLERNTTYRYVVSSFNQVGEGETTEPITVRVMGTGNVWITSIIEEDGRVGIFWQGEGEGTIGYWAYRGLSNESMVLIQTNITEDHLWDEDLVNGVEYHYKIALETLAGLEWTENFTAIPHTVPEAPQGLTAQGHLGYISLNWSAPLDDGGAEVLGYKVFSSTGELEPAYLAEVQGTEFICSGLTVGVRYSFQVCAVNRAGEGKLSEVVAETCGLLPSVPEETLARAGQGYVQLSWSSPLNPGTGGVMSYEVLRSGGAGHKLITVDSSPLNDSTVNNGVTYTYQIRAVNPVGPGDWSEAVTATPTWEGDRPDKVGNLTAAAGEDYIFLTWNAPDDGGQPILRYDLYRGLTPEMLVFMTSAQGNWYNDTELPSEVTYYYRVVAVNVIGDGESSDLVNATTFIPEPEKEEDIWSTFLNGAMPVVTTVLIIALAITLYLGRSMFFRRRGGKNGKGPKEAVKGKPASPPKGRPPQNGKGAK